MQTVAFKAGDTIIAEGDDGDTAFLIVTGSVDVSIGQGKKARTLGVLNAGEVFGEMCLIEPGPRSATVKCQRLRKRQAVATAVRHRDAS